MSKKQSVILVASAVVLSLAANVFFGRFLSAKISTLPVLNRFKLISPQAPIVITSRETVRVSDSGDTLDAQNTAKPRISSVIRVDGEGEVLASGAVNITSDGWFAAAESAMPGEAGGYRVVLADGSLGTITALVPDAATGLVFFKADVSNISTSVFGDSKQLVSGEKILFLTSSVQGQQIRFVSSFITQVQNDAAGIVFSSDSPGRVFGVQSAGPLTAGAAIINMQGQLVGMWNGSTVVSSDVMRQAVSILLSSGGKIARPLFGFTYSYMTKARQSITGLPAGAEVLSASKIKNQAPVLAEGDIITAIDGKSVSETSTVEELLAQYKPGDSVRTVIVRGGQQIEATLLAQ